MKKVLIAIDLQNDFIDGSLGTKEAVAIVPKAIEVIEDSSYDEVYATMDTHPSSYLESFEGKHLPVEHCIKNTNGWQINPEIMKALIDCHATIVEKPTFGSEELVTQLAQEKPSEITLIGLCTDICVISNALMLRAALKDTPIIIIKDACAGVTKEKHEAALAVLQSCQIEVR